MCLHRNSHHHLYISQHRHAWYCFNLANKACELFFGFYFLLYHNYSDDYIIQLSLGGVERKNYTDISIHICTFLCIYINRYIPCIYLKSIFCCFHLILCRMNFWCSIYFILFWFIFSILVIMAMLNSLLYLLVIIIIFLNTERYIHIQNKQGNKIFSCHPNL